VDTVADPAGRDRGDAGIRGDRKREGRSAVEEEEGTGQGGRRPDLTRQDTRHYSTIPLAESGCDRQGQCAALYSAAAIHGAPPGLVTAAMQALDRPWGISMRPIGKRR